MNIVDYVRREERTFSELPFSDVDSLVLSQLSYADLTGVAPGLGEDGEPVPIACLLKVRRYEATVGRKSDLLETKRLVFSICSSRRFREIRLCRYIRELDEKQEKQFSAVNFILPDGRIYVAFRGTDDTLVGWKEDFNLTFKLVPSQIRALEYLIAVAGQTDAPLMLGGHSKGGNLAVFSSLSAPTEIQDRITAIFDHDGPGFRKGIVGGDGYRRIESRIKKTVPEFSLVGMLLESGRSYTVVRARGMGGTQHNPYCWRVSRDGSFEVVESVADGAKYFNRTLREWLDGTAEEDREKFIDTVYALIAKCQEKTLLGLKRNLPKNLKAFIDANADVDAETKHFLRITLRSLLSLMVRNIRPKKSPKTPEPDVEG